MIAVGQRKPRSSPIFPGAATLKKLVITLVKITLSVAIIGYLFWSAVKGEDNRRAFFDMLAQPKRWDLLLAGFGVALAAVMITIVRWCYLVRAVGIEFPVRDALRIGFLGFLFDLAPMGIVGGDLLKAVLLARERPGPNCRAKALASVVVDRVVGLYVLFLAASASIFLGQFWRWSEPRIQLALLGITAVSTVGGIAVLTIPAMLEGRLATAMTRLPKVGRAIESLLTALRIYREDRGILFLSCLLTVPVHGLFAVAVFTISRGLQFPAPAVPWTDFLAIYSVSGILSTIPLPAGPMEFGIVGLYQMAWMKAAAATAIETAKSQGLILALAYRLAMISIAPIGLVYYYLGGRREVAELGSGDGENTC